MQVFKSSLVGGRTLVTNSWVTLLRRGEALVRSKPNQAEPSRTEFIAIAARGCNFQKWIVQVDCDTHSVTIVFNGDKKNYRK